MLINNLKLILSEKQEGKAIFKTENGAEVIMDAPLAAAAVIGQPLYLALDDQPLVSGEENKKALLNELINPDSQ